MQKKLSRTWTILVLRDGTQSPLRLTLSSWTWMSSQLVVLLAFGCVGYLGWQLQAQYGLQGHQVASLALDVRAEKRTIYHHLALSQSGPTRGELRAMIAQQRARRLELGTRRAASLLLTGAVSPEWAASASKAPKGDGSLTWPVREGWFGRGYGSGEGGYHRAVDISGERYSDVLAAAPGIVGYAGNELRNYGNVVLLVHAGGWVTLYAHNERNLVNPGERVRQGQPIAELGSTGRSMGPHVHFELIHQGKNCDPLPFVKRARFSHRHYPESAPIVPFHPELPKPKIVRCGKRMKHPVHEHDEQLLGAASTPRSATEG